MVKEDKISVIIPVYNGEKYINKCLNSILNNTYKNLEVICINDGSKDNSLYLLKQYKNHDSRIHIINKENEGVSAARNDGLAQSTGEYIAFVDIDDWVHVQYFEILMKCIYDTGAEVAACTYKNVFDYKAEDKVIEQMPEISILNGQEMMDIGHLRRLVWGRIYRKNVIGICRYEETLTWGEDTLFNYDLLLHNTFLKMAYVKKELYYYYCGDISLTNRVNASDKYAYVNMYIDKTLAMKNIQKVLINRCCKEVLAYRYAEMFNPNRKLIKQYCEKLIRKCRQLLKNWGGGYVEKFYFIWNFLSVSTDI